MLSAKLPNGEVICCVFRAKGFVVVVVTVVFVVANGELFKSPNVDVVKSGVVVLGVPNVIPVFVVLNGVPEDVTVVPKVLVAVPVAMPNVGLEKGLVVELVVSNCEVAGAKGLLVVGVVVLNGDALGVDIAGAGLWVFPNKFTAGVVAVTPKAFVD